MILVERSLILAAPVSAAISSRVVARDSRRCKGTTIPHAAGVGPIGRMYRAAKRPALWPGSALLHGARRRLPHQIGFCRAREEAPPSSIGRSIARRPV